LIDNYVSAGWEYVGMERVQIEVSPGCLASLLGKSSSFIDFDQVIFKIPLDT